MQPVFRNDLVCSREEQQGVVFYRVDDPKTETNFRLYEIEYLIAQKLDGSRALPDVISAVKSEYNFDISEPDLQRFVGQLEAMGFLVASAPSVGAPGAGDSTAVEAVARPAPLPDLLPEGALEVDRAEQERLLRSALLHVKQGYLVHARDYLLAARELDPKDDRVSRIVGQIELLGDSHGVAEVEYLWEQARGLFPELTAELGPLMPSATPPAPGATPSESSNAASFNPETEEDLKSRVVWMAALVLVAALCVGALVWVVRATGIFASEVPVRVVSLEATRIPVYLPSPAAQLRVAREEWIGFNERGVVTEVLVQAQARVKQGDLIATLELPLPQKKALQQAKAQAAKLAAVHQKAAQRLAVVTSEQDGVKAEMSAASEKLKELQPKALLGQGGASKRDIEKWRRVLQAATAKLKLVDKKAKAPIAAELVARKAAEAAQRRVELIEKRVSGRFLRAPFAAVVAEVAAAPGKPIAAKAHVALLRDDAEVVLTFEGGPAADLAAGGPAFISVQNGKPSAAKILAVRQEGDKHFIDVVTASPGGTFMGLPSASFRLVREFAEPAFRVPAASMLDDNGQPGVYVVVQGRAVRRAVEVLERDAAGAVVRDPSGFLRSGEQVVAATVEAGDVKALSDGAQIKVEAQ